MYQKPSLERFGTFRDLTQVGSSILNADFTFVCATAALTVASPAGPSGGSLTSDCSECNIGIGQLSV